jgi:hypothetical protein
LKVTANDCCSNDRRANPDREQNQLKPFWVCSFGITGTLSSGKFTKYGIIEWLPSWVVFEKNICGVKRVRRIRIVRSSQSVFKAQGLLSIREESFHRKVLEFSWC